MSALPEANGPTMAASFDALGGHGAYGDALRGAGRGIPGMVSAGAGGAGASRGLKAPKKKEDDDALYTTVMLRNIPNKYTQQMLIEQLHNAGFRGHIDYLYLPIDFANRCNCGYCFINFRTVAARERFGSVFDGVAVQSCLPGFNSYKVCQVTKAKWQGREENVRRLRSGPELMAQLAAHPEWLPLLLDERGSQEVFPVDSQGQAPPPLSRRTGRGGKGGCSPSAPAGVGFQAWPAYQGPGADGMFGGRGLSPMGRGAKGPGRGKGRGRGFGRGGPQPGMFPGVQMFPGLPLTAFPGIPGVPVMTEQGLQYLPYGYGGYAAAGGYMPSPYVGWYGQQDGQRQPHDDGYYGGGYGTSEGPATGSPRRVDLNTGDDDDEGTQEL